jgi:hypothetical protein
VSPIDLPPAGDYDESQTGPAEAGRDEEEPMKRVSVTIAAFGLLAVLLVSAHPAFGAVMSLRGRMFSSVAGETPYNVKFDILEFSSAEESLNLIQFMAKGDESGFYARLRSLDKGNMQFIGGRGLNIKFNVAQVYETEKGYRIVLMTEGKSVEPGTTKLLNIPWRFLLVILDLDKNYNGSGRIYEDAAIGATPGGNITLASSFSISKELANVRLVK